MTAKVPRFLPLLSAVAVILGMAGTASAQSHGGGHAAGGAVHAAAGMAHVAAGGARPFSGGNSTGQAGFAGRVGGFSGGARGFAGAPHVTPAAPGGFHGAAAGYAHAGDYHGGGYYAGRPYGGRWVGGRWVGGYWGGGHWGGGYWPRAWYGPGFAWFLPALPLAYATYWWSGVPYYYANDVYYTWNPSYDGYVATDPPPATADAGGSAAIDATAPLAGQVFMYPRDGQSEAQQATDRAECERWAGSQAGGTNSQDDYRRAMTACAEARGYSVK